MELMLLLIEAALVNRHGAIDGISAKNVIANIFL